MCVHLTACCSCIHKKMYTWICFARIDTVRKYGLIFQCLTKYFVCFVILNISVKRHSGSKPSITYLSLISNYTFPFHRYLILECEQLLPGAVHTPYYYKKDILRMRGPETNIRNLDKIDTRKCKITKLVRGHDTLFRPWMSNLNVDSHDCSNHFCGNRQIIRFVTNMIAKWILPLFMKPCCWDTYIRSIELWQVCALRFDYRCCLVCISLYRSPI